MASIAQNEIAETVRGMSSPAMRWSANALVVVTWTSAAVFGAYIVSYFGGFAMRGSPERWNDALPHFTNGPG